MEGINKKYRVAICGYGNLGRGVEKEIGKNPDMELVCIFSRRSKLQTNSNVPVVSFDDVEEWKDKVDVVILCSGSANDLPVQGPLFAAFFNTVDSYDTHAEIPRYYRNVDSVAREENHISIISVGWDPGLFSINRAYMESILPDGDTYTFWGEGVSQGHSDAIRRVPGVKKAVQYTIPYNEAIKAARSGKRPTLSTRDKHYRVCYVVLEEGANKTDVLETITTMPNYFADYNTMVNFISEQEFDEKYTSMPHGGFVIRSGKTGEDSNQVVEFSLKLDSNPEFTASVLIAYARAACRMYENGEKGAKTVLDVPPVLLSNKCREDLIKQLL